MPFLWHIGLIFFPSPARRPANCRRSAPGLLPRAQTCPPVFSASSIIFRAALLARVRLIRTL